MTVDVRDPKNWQKALALLTPKERKHACFVLLLAVVAALVEIVGIAWIMPFLAIIANPEQIETNRYLLQVKGFFGISSQKEFLVTMGFSALMLIFIAAAVRAFSLFIITRFIYTVQHGLSVRLLRNYLGQNYEFFLNTHTGEMAQGLLSEIQVTIAQFLKPAAVLISSTITLIALIALVLVADPYVAIVSGVVLATAYILIFGALRNYIERLGKERTEANRSRFQIAVEALGGIKEAKLLGLESSYISRFTIPSLKLSQNTARQETLSQIPKFAIEAIAFGGIIALCLVLMNKYEGQDENVLAKVLPLLGLYAFAGYRMLPAAQQIYSSFASMRFGASALDKIFRDITHKSMIGEGFDDTDIMPIPLLKTLELKNISYLYPNTEEGGLSDISLRLDQGMTLGIVGTTGAGKTTLVDLILGLLNPLSGEILVDNLVIDNSSLRGWQKSLGYVAQDIFLSDSSIKENIALGTPADQIDMKQIEKCTRMAQIHDFIISDLPEKYDTKVGERGVRLSGGQRQRLGIARALYRNPSLIVFDEATSALDNRTEKSVMEAILALMGHKTMIIIAHRLSTVRICDVIIVLDKGKVVGRGDYETLLKNNIYFQSIAELADA